MKHSDVQRWLSQDNMPDAVTQQKIDAHLIDCVACRQHAQLVGKLRAEGWNPYAHTPLAPAKRRALAKSMTTTERTDLMNQRRLRWASAIGFFALITIIGTYLLATNFMQMPPQETTGINAASDGTATPLPTQPPIPLKTVIAIGESTAATQTPLPTQPVATATQAPIGTLPAVTIDAAGNMTTVVVPTPPTATATVIAEPTPQTDADGNQYTRNEEGERVYAQRDVVTDLGIQISLVSDSNERQTRGIQIDDKFYVTVNHDAPQFGQWVQVFDKVADESLEEAIRRVILEEEGFSAEGCQIRSGMHDDPESQSQHPNSFVIADIYVESADDIQDCNATYVGSGGIAYFIMDSEHPERFAFLSIGQYYIPINAPPWQTTIHFLD